MHLEVEAEPVPVEPFDQVGLPQRFGHVQRPRVEPRDECAQLALAAGPWQRAVPEVKVEIDLVVVELDERRRDGFEGGVAQPVVERRRERPRGAQ